MSLLTGLIWAWAIMTFGSVGLGYYAVTTLDHGKARRNQGAVDANTATLSHELSEMRGQLALLKLLLLLALVLLTALLVKVYGVHL